MRRLIALATVLGYLGACGGTPSSPADAADPEEDAATCRCPSARSVVAETFLRTQKDAEKDHSYISMDPMQKWPVAASCVLINENMGVPALRAVLTNLTIYCGWRYIEWSYAGRATSSLLDPGVVDDVPFEGPICDECPEAEGLRRRMRQVGNQILIPPPGSPFENSVSCPDNGVLIGGSCVGDDGMQLANGPSPDQPDTWACGWQNNEFLRTTSAIATCVRPPREGTAPESVPLRERVVHVDHEEPVGANSQARIQASCAPGDLLMSGGCRLTSYDPPFDQVSLFSSGFPYGQEDSHTWECGWTNATTQQATARTTAVCLRPLDE